jgi:hypothetical protein
VDQGDYHGRDRASALYCAHAVQRWIAEEPQ